MKYFSLFNWKKNYVIEFDECAYQYKLVLLLKKNITNYNIGMVCPYGKKVIENKMKEY
jgi:hypothetical protein